ncbi:hypothetical protein EHI8A_053120 [Entamoeba histolytica HM-1:IMSS-B]|uniref:PPM-type phosphatase domain-containing protein n=5 Tax=Entamoeba histolytica TaxID=5759 RepID=C4M6T4_ENTH1|nr:hypothetical protein EHI_054200 [Entamoeba histolytica HM-1:IMSS]EMH76165.1 hypothetical protein EHI8A_053120 [Entamoeba histolytica HM-1:IMSS-B]EMS16493.1 hypothetical protein KM1_102290 [Entamoeba histolytica HM-3:IMSS]ENY65089.1 hypothetical protein EHI7A_053710 [Entamoeba histolytica HM-1:IMSS-A]GAT97221.1 hypothetical protein CL6EHI_054200 [Entamoeba histolytica]EAL46019.1 hypothetical protein EHI_054200 [Entamoeba histolytica HM-1:IMSS]|eukprot:XP_651405.1 hypothetical protein EHI_054200 [Entamoeba histolytica HM-1:IMSS]
MHQTYSINFKKIFQKEIKTIPKKEIKRINNKQYSKHLITDALSIKSRDQHFAMASISTYPIINGVKQGEPNCDKAGIVRFSNATFIALADGCGWGDKPSFAAKLAVTSSLEFVISNITTVSTLRESASLLVETIANAHQIICSSYPNNNAQTTLLVALSFTLIDEQQVTVVLSVGDCRLFHYSLRECKVKKIVGTGHHSIDETKECIAALGNNQLGTDIINGSQLAVCECEEGDLIFALTDGMYDNFDPTIIKEKKPYDQLLNEILGIRIKRSANLNSLVEELCSYTIGITQTVREFHQNNPTKRRRDGLPGKLDHSTIIVYSINIHNLDIGLVDKYSPELFKTLKPLETKKPLVHSISFDEQHSPLMPLHSDPVRTIKNSSKISIHSVRLNTFSPPRTALNDHYTPCLTPRIYRDVV